MRTLVQLTGLLGLIACGSGGSARLGGASDAPANDGGQLPVSCIGLAATCGPTGDWSCCGSPLVPGGTFFRSYDGTPEYPNMGFPATVSAFRLDKYEVTVSRFRRFVNAGLGTQPSPPLAGAGAHATLADSGWDPTWNARLSADTTALVAHLNCGAPLQSWSDVPGSNESRPINCVTWLEAMAFCAWDGGYLPTEAEWNYAAAGGSEQREYPWPNTPDGLVDCSYANYAANAPCSYSEGHLMPVGSESPKGDGRWGQADLAGNVFEYTLDWDTEPYTNPCNDCANVTPGTLRMIRGGQSGEGAYQIRTAFRDVHSPEAPKLRCRVSLRPGTVTERDAAVRSLRGPKCSCCSGAGFGLIVTDESSNTMLDGPNGHAPTSISIWSPVTRTG
jgi:sulfatase modifying factor 1